MPAYDFLIVLIEEVWIYRMCEGKRRCERRDMRMTVCACAMERQISRDLDKVRVRERERERFENYATESYAMQSYAMENFESYAIYDH